MAFDVLDLIDVLGLSQVRLVGTSFGAYEAMEVVRNDARGRVAAVINAGAGFDGGRDSFYPRKVRQAPGSHGLVARSFDPYPLYGKHHGGFFERPRGRRFDRVYGRSKTFLFLSRIFQINVTV